MKAYELFHSGTKEQIGFMWLREDVKVTPSEELPSFLELRDAQGAWFAVMRNAEVEELQTGQARAAQA